MTSLKKEKSQILLEKLQKSRKKSVKNQKNEEKTENYGLVLKKEADRFLVRFEGGHEQIFSARKNLKKEGVFVGDYVLVGKETIEKIRKRKNLLIRPPIANLDRMLIVVAPLPKPDLYLVDKLLVFCKVNDIQPILCVNKSDLDEKTCKNIKKTYEKLAKTLVFSTFDESVQKIMPEIVGVCALAGQSAVGKSSIINALKKETLAKVDTFSKKVERGKQTTRVVQLYEFSNGFLADTAGFSKLEERLLDVKAPELKKYYPDFLPFAGECKYLSCTHENSKDCGVLKAVQEGKIALSRYENYKKMLKILQILDKTY